MGGACTGVSFNTEARLLVEAALRGVQPTRLRGVALAAGACLYMVGGAYLIGALCSGAWLKRWASEPVGVALPGSGANQEEGLTGLREAGPVLRVRGWSPS